MSRVVRALTAIVDADDAKIIAVALVGVLVVGLLLVLLAGAAGIAVAVFEGARGL